jgi:hypothetical protein
MRCKKCRCQFEPTEFNFPFCKATSECIQAGKDLKIARQKRYQNKFKMKEKKPKAKKPKQKKLQVLLKDFEKVFNAWIRQRDSGKPCISCNQNKVLQAGHYWPVSGYKALRFDEDNVHGECEHDNAFNEGHLIGYGINLPGRIGPLRYKELLSRGERYKQGRLQNEYYMGGKWNREGIEKGIEYYKSQLK